MSRKKTSLKQESQARALATLSVCQGFVAAASYFLTILLANYFGPEKFGYYSEILITASFLTIFIVWGTDQTIPLRVSQGVEIKKIIAGSLVLRLSLTGLAIFPVGYYFRDSAETAIFIIALIIPCFNFSSFFEVSQKNIHFAIIYAIERLCYIGSISILVALDIASLKAVFGLYAVFSIASLVIQSSYFDLSGICKRQSRPEALQLLILSTPVFLVSLSSFAYGGLSRLILVEHNDHTALGIFSAAWQVITIGTIFQGQVSRIWRLGITRAVQQQDRNHLKKELITYFFYSSVPLCVVSLVLSVFSETIAEVIFDDNYAGLGGVLSVLSLYLIVINVAALINILWVAIDRRREFVSYSVAGGLSVLLFLFFYGDSFSLFEFSSAVVAGHAFTTLLLATTWVILFNRLGGLVTRVRL